MHLVKDVLYKINYVLDTYSKRRLPLVFLIILGGALAELVGVSIVLPIINLAMDPGEIYQNSYCRMIASVTGSDSPQYIMIVLILVTIVVYIAKNIYLVLMNNTIYRFTMNVQRKMAVRLMKAYVRQPYAFFLTRNSSENLRSITSDTANFQQVIINVLQIITNALLCLVILAYLIKTNWMITLVVLIVLGACFLLVFLYSNQRLRRLGKENQILEGKIIQTLQETFHGIKEIKILNREEFFVHTYEGNYARQAENRRKANLFNIIPKYLIEAVCITAIMLCLIVAILIRGGYGSLVGQLAVFAMAAFKLLPAANSIYSYFTTVMYHRASIDLVYNDIFEADHLEKNIINTDEERTTKEKISYKNTIRISNVHFSYDGAEEEVLKGVDLTINKGEAIGFMGKSGGGKTTTVDVMLGLLKPQKGNILVDGVDIGTDYKGWLSFIGYIPQTIYLADTTIRENIAFGLDIKDINEEAVQRAVDEAQLREFVDSLPDGLNTMIGEAGVRLSGGQRQRIGIARALYNNPDVLVLDEATSALDNETEKAVMEAIDHLHGSKTLIIIAHRLTTITNCDKVYEITNGIAVERDPKQLIS